MFLESESRRDILMKQVALTEGKAHCRRLHVAHGIMHYLNQLPASQSHTTHRTHLSNGSRVPSE